MFDNISSMINESILSQFIDNIKNKNNIFFLGIGKSQHVANIFSDMMKLISMKSINLNPSSVLHGDIGMIDSNDIVIIVSKSGETKEIIDIVKQLTLKNISTLLLTMNKDSTLSSVVSDTIILPYVEEIDSNNMIPSNSIIVFIMFCNKIIKKMLYATNSKEYIVANHVNGYLGSII